jgi:serine/threonine protein kinase/tetratricopeptide (TPR) repeat protein
MTQHAPEPDRPDAWIYVDCVGRIASDLAAGKLASRDAYRALWPAAPALVDAAWRDAVGDDGRGPAPPSEIGGYRILRELGRGGQAVVYLAHDAALDRPVALKVLRAPFLDADDVRAARFRREAEATARLEHPGVAAVYATGVDRGDAWIAMRYVAGETLARRIASCRAPAADAKGRARATPLRAGRRGTAPAREAVRDVVAYFAAAADAVQAAHDRGLLHRDLKPANLMVTPAGEPVVLDFGVAREAGAAGSPVDLTATGATPGTPAYLAPEVLRGEATDARADVWSLGVSLYEALVGRRPFDAPTREATFKLIAESEPAPPSRRVEVAPRDLDAVLAVALEKDPARRYASAGDLADDLRRVLADLPVRARPAGPLTRLTKWARRDPARATFAALLVLAAAGLFALGGFLLARAPELRAARAAAAAEAREEALGAAFAAYGEGDFPLAAARFEALLAESFDPEAACGAALSAAGRDGDDAGAARLARDAERGALPASLRDRLARHFAAASRPASRAADSRSTDSRGGSPISDDPPTAVEPDASAGSRSLAAFLDALVLRERALVEGRSTLLRAAEAAGRATYGSPRPRLPYHLLRTDLLAKLDDRPAVVDAARLLRATWPRSADALARAAGLLADVGATELALEFAAAALALAPEGAMPRLMRGAALVAAGRVEEALGPLVAARDASPRVPRVRAALGAAYYRLERYEEAATELDAATRLPRAEATAWANLAALRIQRGDPAGAAAAAEAALAIRPRDVVALMNLGVAQLEMRRLDDAEKTLRRARAEGPDDAFRKATHATALAASGRAEEGLRLCAEALAEDPGRPDVAFAVARTYADHGRLNEALPLMAAALERRPREAGWRTTYATALVKAGRLADAEREAARAMAENPRLEGARYALFAAAMTGKDFPTALRRAEEGVAALPQSSRMHETLALARAESGDLAGAVEAARRGVELGPTAVSVRRNFGGLLYRAGRFAEAAESHRKLIELAPDDLRAHRALLDALAKLPDADLEPEFRRWADRRKDDPFAQVDLCRALLRDADADDAARIEALARAETAMRLLPAGHVDALSVLAESLLAVGRPHGARDAYERALKLPAPTDKASPAARALERLRSRFAER